MVEKFENGAEADEVVVTEKHVDVTFIDRDIKDMLANATKLDSMFPGKTVTYSDEHGNEILVAPRTRM